MRQPNGVPQPRYSAAHRSTATREKRVLYTLDIDRRHIKGDEKRYTSTGVASPHLSRYLRLTQLASNEVTLLEGLRAVDDLPFLHDVGVLALLERSVRGARDRKARKGQKHPRWVAVSSLFSLGSTYSKELCHLFDLNPDEEVAR